MAAFSSMLDEFSQLAKQRDDFMRERAAFEKERRAFIEEACHAKLELAAATDRVKQLEMRLIQKKDLLDQSIARVERLLGHACLAHYPQLALFTHQGAGRAAGRDCRRRNRKDPITGEWLCQSRLHGNESQAYRYAFVAARKLIDDSIKAAQDTLSEDANGEEDEDEDEPVLPVVLPMDQDAIEERYKHLRKTCVLRYAVCQQCAMHLEHQHGMRTVVKDAKKLCMCCYSAGQAVQDYSRPVCKNCSLELCWSVKEHPALFGVSVDICNSGYGHNTRHAPTWVLPGVTVDHTLQMTSPERSVSVFFEKDTRKHPGYSSEWERLVAIQQAKSKAFQHVVIIRLNPSEGGDKDGLIKDPVVACLLARQWALWGLLFAKKDFTVVYLNYTTSNVHLIDARQKAPENVIVAQGPPSDEQGHAIFAMTPTEWRFLARQSLKPVKISRDWAFWHEPMDMAAMDSDALS